MDNQNTDLETLALLQQLQPLQQYCASVEPSSTVHQDTFERAWQDYRLAHQSPTTQDLTPIVAVKPHGHHPVGSSIPREQSLYPTPPAAAKHTSPVPAATVKKKKRAVEQDVRVQVLKRRHNTKLQRDQRSLPKVSNPDRFHRSNRPDPTRFPRMHTKTADPNRSIPTTRLSQTKRTGAIPNKKRHFEKHRKEPRLPHCRSAERCPTADPVIYKRASQARFALRAKTAFIARRAKTIVCPSNDRWIPDAEVAAKSMSRREKEFILTDGGLNMGVANQTTFARYAEWANYALEAEDACLIIEDSN